MGRQPVWINLHETSMSRSWPQHCGNVVRRTRWSETHRPPRVKPKRADYRGTVTAIVMTCQRKDVQTVLPQVILGNEHVFPKVALEEATGRLPGTVHFWRQKSSWNTAATMCEVLKLLVEALQQFEGMQPTLLVEYVSLHVHRDVLEQALMLKLFMCCLPASMTWLLQPLDTHCLVWYKAYLRKLWRREQADSAGHVSFSSWIPLLAKVSTVFLCKRSWTQSFEAAGLVGD